MTDRPISFAATVLALAGLLSGGCANNDKLERAMAELAVCRKENALLTAEAQAWQQRFDRAAVRWTHIESSVVGAVPNALAEFDAERDRILELVPEQVQYEVASYLDEYFGALMSAFRSVQGDGKDVRLQLEATQEALSVLGQDTQKISSVINEAVAAEAEKRRAVAKGLEALQARVVAFARERVNCTDCEYRVRLNKREREVVLGFHAELINAISTLQTQISR